MGIFIFRSSTRKIFLFLEIRNLHLAFLIDNDDRKISSDKHTYTRARLMSPLPDGRLMIGTNKIDGDVRQEIDKSKQVCMPILISICHHSTYG